MNDQPVHGKAITLLHTSDWHIGKTLHERKRYDESEAFLGWLAQTIAGREVDVLLVAGDIFDTGTPSNYAQELYYSFLRGVLTSSCRHVVVTGGNHDSPTFLNAPRELLKALHIHVIGEQPGEPGDEVLVLRSRDGEPELLVCAVPYLRDRDVRTAEAGESIEEKDRKLIEGICNHYAEVIAHAEKKRLELGANLPIVAMGHLYAAGGTVTDGDGVRELYVGSLARVPATIFPDALSYVALGHLHSPQKVGRKEWIRYSGAPICMGFGEAGQGKSVTLVRLNGCVAEMEAIPVPSTRHLESISGDWERISARILELKAEGGNPWIEVQYDGTDVIQDLRNRLDEAVKNTGIEILKISNNRIVQTILGQMHEGESLEDLSYEEVFERCLDSHEIPDEQREEYRVSYREIVKAVFEADEKAE